MTSDKISVSKMSKMSKTSKTSKTSNLSSHSSSKQIYIVNKENGLYDPNGLLNNPLTNEPYKNLYANETISRNNGSELVPKTYANLSNKLSTLKVYENKDIIIDTILQNQIILATASTGVGKTVLVPRIALHTFNYKQKVLCTIPKQLATQRAAQYVAQCMDVKIGEHVGYFYRNARETNKNGIKTMLTFTTTGSVISMMTGTDPLLSEFKCIIIDEAHERSVDTDQLLLLLKRACKIRRDLKVIIMSATIDLDRFRAYYPQSQFKFGEVVAGTETTFKVQAHWTNRPVDWKPLAADITMKILQKTSSGDIMIFVKSGSDAMQFCSVLDKSINDFRKTFRQHSNTKKVHTKHNTHTTTQTKKTSKMASKMASKTQSNVLVIPPEYIINPLCIKLDGKGTSKEDALIATDENLYKKLKDINGYPYSRKVVVSTNVAESSVTVDGVVYIIETGFEYAEAYEPNSRARSLLESTIAQSAVIQRRGRAGRTRPGYCFHLYSEKEFSRFDKYPIPSIEKSDITSNILDLMRMPDANNIKKLRNVLDEFISPPHEKFILNSLRTLDAIGAITSINDDGIITPMGHAICKFRAISPCFARSIIASHFYGVSRSVCDIIALACVAEGRITNVFTKYYPDKKKSPEWNKKEFFRHKNIIKTFEHSYGDYMTLLKAYRMYMNFVNNKTEGNQQRPKPNNIPTPLEKKTGRIKWDSNGNVMEGGAELVDSNDGNDNININTNNKVDIIEPGVNKWCKDHFLNAKKLSKVMQTSRQLYQTLQLIVKPYQFIKKPTREAMSIKEVNSVLSELYNDVCINADGNNKCLHINDEDGIQHIGGFVRTIEKEEEMEKLETNIKRFDIEDDNIMMALSIGNFVNVAMLAKGQKDSYVSCFAQVKKMCKIDRDSFVRGNPEMVMFHEIFQSSVDGRFLKLNMVNKVPSHVWNIIIEKYGKYIKFCS